MKKPFKRSEEERVHKHDGQLKKLPVAHQCRNMQYVGAKHDLITAIEETMQELKRHMEVTSNSGRNLKM